MSDALARQAESRSPPQQRMPARRLLIPVKNANDAARAVSHAIRRRAEGHEIAVCLLHVEEASAPWQALVGSGAALAAKSRRNRDVFAELFSMLDGLDIEYAAYVRSGPLVFTILDAAEELGCDEIVVPASTTGPLRLLSREVVATLLARQRSIPVVAVDKHGIAARE